MPLNPPCCENAMHAVAQQSANALLIYLASQPRTPELIALVQRLIVIHPTYTKLLEVFVDRGATA